MTALLAAALAVYLLGWAAGRQLARGHIPSAVGTGFIGLTVVIYVAICLATG